jgi:hypothetical protein
MTNASNGKLGLFTIGTGTATITGNIQLTTAQRNVASITETGTLNVGGNIGGTFTPTDGTNASTVNYNGSGPQNICPARYYHLATSTGGSKSPITTLVILGNLTIGEGSTYFAGTGRTDSVRGNWINNGTFVPGFSTVVFTDSFAQQSISGNSSTSFYNLRPSKNGQTLNVNSNIAINRALLFSNGVIEGPGLTTFNAGSFVTGAVSNATTTAYIGGRVEKKGNTAFVFPVGKGGKYVPIEISASSDVSNSFVAEYFVGNAHNLGPVNTATGLQQVSACEYWNLVQNAGVARVHVTLGWSNNNACPGDNYITNVASMVAAHFDGTTSTWNDYGPKMSPDDGKAEGTTSEGSVIWYNVPKYGYFTLGTTSLLNALPVVFANVTATKREGGVVVSFSNLTEEKVASYTVERSGNGNNFQDIGTLEPQLNNNSRADYTFIDHAPLNGDNFYRIRAVETTGKSIYSAVVRLWSSGMATGMVIYPNPGSINSTLSMQLGNLPAGKYRLRVFNQHGQAVHTAQFSHTGGAVSTPLSTSGLSAGWHILELNGTQKITRTFLLQ